MIELPLLMLYCLLREDAMAIASDIVDIFRASFSMPLLFIDAATASHCCFCQILRHTFTIGARGAQKAWRGARSRRWRARGGAASRQQCAYGGGAIPLLCALALRRVICWRQARSRRQQRALAARGSSMLCVSICALAARVDDIC